MLTNLFEEIAECQMFRSFYNQRIIEPKMIFDGRDALTAKPQGPGPGHLPLAHNIAYYVVGLFAENERRRASHLENVDHRLVGAV